MKADFTASSSKICDGSAITFSDNSGGTSEWTTYNWDFGVGASPSTATGIGPHIVNYSGSGIKTVRLTIANGIFSFSSKIKTITVYAIPETPEVFTEDKCNGTSTLSTTALGTLIWSTLESSKSITVTLAGIYTVTTTIDGCTSSPGSSTAAPKTTPAAPVVTVIDNCNGTSTLSTTAEGTLLWSTMESSSTITVTAAGIYTVTATIDGCSSSPASATATPKTTPLAPVVTVVNYCGGTALSTKTAGALLWNTTETSSSITVTAVGVYTVVTTVNGCTSSPGRATAAPKTIPPAPVIASTIQPKCTVSTGSVELNGLPSGTWTINPGSINGTTVSTTISGLATGTHSFTVTNSSGCTSGAFTDVVINAQPEIPSPPSAGKITQPSCTLSTGSVELTGLVATGLWTLTRYPGTIISTGTGTGTTISGLNTGTYNFTFTNSAGCLSAPSGNVVINTQPQSPTEPSQITDCTLGFGRAVITVTSPIGAGYEYSIDSGVYSTNTSFSDQNNGTHFITVRNSSGCTTTGFAFSVSCGCSNQPTITLSSANGNTCDTSALTVSNNLFGGSATTVSITSNGGGIISPVSANLSPFSFTYTPSESDSGKKIIISVNSDNPLGSPCEAGTATYTLSVNTKPSRPVVGIITQMSCTDSTGSVILNALPAVGTWIMTSNPGSISISGSGTSTTLTGLVTGSYSFTVTNSEGCTSVASANAVISSNTGSPLAPTIVAITSPTCNVATGSILLSGLPATGSWTLTRFPDNITSTGSGTSITISGLLSGTYNYIVTDAVGCISAFSKNIVVPVQPSSVTIVITNPPSLCSPGKADLTNPLITAGSSTGIIFTYFSDASATKAYPTPSRADSGTYFIKGSSSSGCYDIKPVTVRINQLPVANAGPDKILYNQFTATMEAQLTHKNDTGTWSVIAGNGEFLNNNSENTTVTELSVNENIFLWTVRNGICSEAYDTVSFIVRDMQIHTLITPNMDGLNDYFELGGLESMGKTELIIFDRRGVQVYKNVNYDNLWNGLNYNGNPLHDDTYFYVIKPENSKSFNGFIVIRR